LVPGNAPVMSYNAQQYRVRIELSRAMALASALPPPDLIQRAKAKLESVQKSGKIIGFDIYEEKLRSVWTALRTADNMVQTLSVSFTLAGGYPEIPWLKIENAGPNKPGLYLTTDGKFDIKATPREWIRAVVLKSAKELGIGGGLFMPHLQSALMRLYQGDSLNKFHIASQTSIPAIPLDGKVFTVMANKSRSEIVIFIGSVAAIQADSAIENLCGVVTNTIEKMKAAGAAPMRFLKDEMITCIKSAMTGPERVGVGHPFGVLAAIPKDNPAPMLAKVPVKKMLSFAVSEDRMSATIVNFDAKWYKEPSFKISKDFLIEQTALSQIRFGVEDDLVAAIEDSANNRGNLNGLVAARGKVAVKGQEPYLHLVYKDAPEPTADGAVVNVRDAQQRTVVRKGQFVAEARYKVNPEIGSNVLGQPLLPEVGETLSVTVGEGIQQREPGKFYALYDGLPKFEEGNLTVTKTFILDGDVNLKSGNIYFDGPVEIKGSIEAGALVRVRGPLKVHGSISGGTVISKEPIEVLQSIVTGDQGKIICGTQVIADFIENSQIECDGTVTVNKALVSSNVRAGNLIQAIAPDGIIGGGSITCRGMVHAANIGFAKGARTIFKVGVDYKLLRRIEIRQKRLANLNTAQERYKQEFRELAQKRENQLTAKHKAQKESLKVKMVNVKPLIEKATAYFEKAKSTMTFNGDAIIAATNVFASNCVIEIGGNGVVMETDTIAAAVCAKKRRDSNIVTYDEIRSEIEKKLSGASSAAAPPASDGKKAS
jgi:uncharacterized protein (DUF342 family)